MARIILVHGFWADGSSWAGVIPRLLDAGHDVTAVQLPLSSQDDDVATVRRALARGTGPAVLAGHSYGGVVITRAGADPAVGALAYVSAYAPDADEDVQGIGDKYPAPGGAGIRPSEDGHLWFDTASFPELFAGDVDPAVARTMAVTQGPASFACLTTFSEAPAWRSTPSTWLLSADDKVISPDAQRWMAERAGAKVTEVAGSHCALVSHPEETAASITAAADLLG